MRVIAGWCYPEEDVRLITMVHSNVLIKNTCETFLKTLNPRYFRAKYSRLGYDEEENRKKFKTFADSNVGMVVRFRLTEKADSDYKKTIATNGRSPFAVNVMDKMKYQFFAEGITDYYVYCCEDWQGLVNGYPPKRLDFIDFDLGHMKDEGHMMSIGNGIAFGRLIGEIFNDCARFLDKGRLVDSKTFPLPSSPEY